MGLKASARAAAKYVDFDHALTWEHVKGMAFFKDINYKWRRQVINRPCDTNPKAAVQASASTHVKPISVLCDGQQSHFLSTQKSSLLGDPPMLGLCKFVYWELGGTESCIPTTSQAKVAVIIAGLVGP